MSTKRTAQARRKNRLPAGRCTYVLEGPDGREGRHSKKANAVKAARTLVRKSGEPVDVMKLCMNRAGTSRKHHDLSITSCLETKSGKVVCKTLPRQKARSRPNVTRISAKGKYVTRRMTAREAASYKKTR